MPDVTLTPRQREVLEVIEQYQRERGYPPSVREIGEAVGLTSPSTVHAHLATLQKLGFLRARPHEAPGHRGALRRHLRRPGRAPAGPARAARGRRRRRHRRPRPGEHRGDPPPPGRLHRRGRPLHAAGAGRLDDRGRHRRRRLRRVPRPEHGRQRRHRRGRHPRRRGHGQDVHAARAARSPCSRRTPGSRRWSSTPTRSRSSARSSRSSAASDPRPDRPHRRRTVAPSARIPDEARSCLGHHPHRHHRLARITPRRLRASRARVVRTRRLRCHVGVTGRGSRRAHEPGGAHRCRPLVVLLDGPLERARQGRHPARRRSRPRPTSRSNPVRASPGST